MIQLIHEDIPDLDRKLLFIRQFLREGCEDADILNLSRRILAEAGPSQVTFQDPWTVANALYAWVKEHIPFERDPQTGEIADLGGNAAVEGPADLIQNAAATLQRGSGDCVALTILLGSLACVAGLRIRIGLQDTQGRGIDHVLLLVGLPRAMPIEWLALDLTADNPGELREGFGTVQVLEVEED